MAIRRGAAGQDFIFGTNQGDRLEGLGGDDSLRGGQGNDTLLGGDGGDYLVGGAGNDLIRPGRNADVKADDIIAGRGSDTFDFAGAGPQSGADFAFYSVSYREMLGGVDARIGAASGVVAKSARDGGGVDSLRNIAFSPETEGFGFRGSHRNDRIEISLGRDVFVDINGAGGNDTIIGGASFNRLSYFDFDASGIEVRVASSTNGKMSGSVDDNFGGVDTFRGIDEIRGSRFDDRFTGSGGRDRFITDEGDDFVDGRGGYDIVRYDRNNVLRIDVDLAKNTALNVWRSGDGRRDGDYVDTLLNVEEIRGTRTGDDVIRGKGAAENFRTHAGDDRLIGRGGNDTLSGGEDEDTLEGGSGADQLFGEDDDDRLIGGAGNDAIDGGSGDDVFVFRRGNGRDVVRDFRDGEDRIEIGAGASGFGQLAITQNGGDAVIAFANVVITLENIDRSVLDSSDFIFA